MDRYQRVEKPRPESAINENEMRITAQGLIRNYLSYASTLLQLKLHLKSWNQNIVGDIHKKVADLEVEIDRLLQNEVHNPFSALQNSEPRKAQLEDARLLHMQEVLWRQKSRVKWPPNSVL